MNISVNEFVNDIASKLVKKQVSAFIGAGVSRELNLPDWKNLFEESASKMQLDINDIQDYYQFAQYYCNKYSASDLKKNIRPKLQTFISSSPTLDRIVELEFQSIWTTNFDDGIETCFYKHGINCAKVYADKNLANINTEETTVIYKINGDISDLENIVLTQRDWENFSYNRPIMIAFLKKELVSNTFLFLGYSFRDNLIKSVLSDIRQFVGEGGNYHYVLLKKEYKIEFQYYIEDLEKNYNIKTVLLDDYSKVPLILSSIYEKIIEKNIFISGRLDDNSEEVEHFANELLKELSVELLKEQYNICTGMGRKIGYYVAGPSIQYLLSHGNKNIDQRLRIRPFDDNLHEKDFTKYRKYLLDQNHIVIFAFGQKIEKGVSQNSKGVLEEFEIACNMKKVIIPIGSTGFAAKEIFNKVKKNITEYPYLESYMTILESETSINLLSKVIVSIVKSVIENH